MGGMGESTNPRTTLRFDRRNSVKVGPGVEALRCEVALYFRNEFRGARAAALKDAEGYQRVLFAVERLGAYLTEKQLTLGGYKDHIVKLVACHHPLGKELPDSCKDYHIEFSKLYQMVMTERNDALHQGAFARILTSHLVQLSTMLEDTLTMTIMADEIKNYMTRNPVCAHPWQPVSFIRQTMLENSFSYIPVYMKSGEEEKSWRIVSDYAIAKYLRLATGTPCRKKLLSTSLECAVASSPWLIEKAVVVTPKEKVGKALDYTKRGPILVERGGCAELLGIATPFDLM